MGTLSIIYPFYSGTLGGGSIFRVTVSNGNEVAPEEINVTFDDVKVSVFCFATLWLRNIMLN